MRHAGTGIAAVLPAVDAAPVMVTAHRTIQYVSTAATVNASPRAITNSKPCERRLLLPGVNIPLPVVRLDTFQVCDNRPRFLKRRMP